MDFLLKQAQADRVRATCVVVGLHDGGALTPAAQAIDKAAGGLLSKLAKTDALAARAGSVTTLHAVAGIPAERVVVAGLGKVGALTLKGFREAVVAAVKAAGSKDAVLFTGEWDVSGTSDADRVLHTVTAARDATYRFDRTKSKKPDGPAPLETCVIATVGKPGGAIATALARGVALADGVTLAKDLGNLPPNFCTPTYLAETAVAVGKQHKAKVTVLDRKDIEKLGMGSFLSVTNGSAQPPKFIVMEWLKGPKKQKPVVLVGKGITFDTGGISLKPGADMDEMKYDMSGAGSVIGTMKAVAAMDLAINLVVLVPTCENMPSGTATRPGDVVTSMSGKTIEVLNTDAEGRLILCDALTYAERYDPIAVIDVATLTGACVIALGHVATGLFSNNDALAAEVLGAGQAAWDRAWHMPVWDDYQEQIKSPFADLANIGGRPAGSVTAACFLARFAEKYPWVHLDIAGTAWKSGRDKGSTGRPVPLLTTFLMQRADA